MVFYIIVDYEFKYTKFDECETYIHNQIEPFAFEHYFCLQVLKISSSYAIAKYLTQKY